VTFQTSAPNPGCFMVGSSFLGLATQVWSNSCPLLVAEIAFPMQRAVITTLYNTGWFVESLVAAWTTYGM
jgi:hypothetical protein